MRQLRLVVAVLVLLVVSACNDEPGSVEGENPDASGPLVTTDSHDDAGPQPLPPPAGDRPPEELPDFEYRHWPNSARVQQGVPYRIKVGTHCGFGPIDFDGSFFEAVPGSALTADLPDPEDIGEISLEGENMALYISSTGANITLTRLEAEYVDVPVCE